MKEIDSFINTIAKLEPVEFMGLARVLKVPLFTGEVKRANPVILLTFLVTYWKAFPSAGVYADVKF